MQLQVSDYAIDAWSDRLGSPIKSQLMYMDWSAPYEVDAAHLFELENGKFAVVIESGCSCYDYSDADVDVYETLEEAKANYPQK